MAEKQNEVVQDEVKAGEEKSAKINQTEIKSIEIKLNLMEKKDNPIKFLLKRTVPAIAAGAIVAMAGAAYVGTLGETNSKFIASFLFAFGAILCVLLNAELFTSKVYVYTTLAFEKKKKVYESIYILLWIVLFNAIGAVIFMGLYSLGKPSGFLTSKLEETALAKLEHGELAILAQSILCNFFICIAKHINVKFKENQAIKIVDSVICMFLFTFLGFQHSVANFGFFSLAFFMGVKLSVEKVAINLALSILGNAIGGVLVSFMFSSNLIKWKGKKA